LAAKSSDDAVPGGDLAAMLEQCVTPVHLVRPG
jgi:hypothetical protein